MTNFPDTFVVEVRKQQVPDANPPICIFLVTMNIDWGKKGDGVKATQGETFTFSRSELLNTYLRGVASTLSMTTERSVSLSWDISPEWSEPFGKRWTIQEGSIAMEEDLDSEGNVL